MAKKKMMDEKTGSVGDSKGGFSDSEMKAGYRALSDGGLDELDGPPGNDGEYEYKPGSIRNDSRGEPLDPSAKAYKAKKGMKGY